MSGISEGERNRKGDLYDKYNIELVKFTNVYGDVLWENGMFLSGLYGPGQLITVHGEDFEIRRVAIDGNTQIVNLETEKEEVPWGIWDSDYSGYETKEDYLCQK